MANPLPNEQLLYERLQKEHVSIDPLIWDAMYYYLGDYISVIHFIASYAVERQEPISLEDAQKILTYTGRIKEVVDEILHPERLPNDHGPLEKVKESHLELNPLVKEFFSHYLGNDTYVINLCASFYLDPDDPRPIPVSDAQKILGSTESMKQFLDRLREVTNRGRGEKK